MNNYRDVTEADIGKECQFWDNDSKGKWLAILKGIGEHCFYDMENADWTYCRIEVEDAVEEVVKELEPFKVEVPTNMTSEEARQTLKKASEEKLGEGWYLVEDKYEHKIVKYLTSERYWQYTPPSNPADGEDFIEYIIISKMEAVR